MSALIDFASAHPVAAVFLAMIACWLLWRVAIVAILVIFTVVAAVFVFVGSLFGR